MLPTWNLLGVSRAASDDLQGIRHPFYIPITPSVSRGFPQGMVSFCGWAFSNLVWLSATPLWEKLFVPGEPTPDQADAPDLVQFAPGQFP